MLVGVFVTTTHRLRAVESGFRALSTTFRERARRPKSRRNRGDRLHTQTERCRSGAVMTFFTSPERSPLREMTTQLRLVLAKRATLNTN